MTTRVKVVIVVVSLATAFATGRFTVPTKTVTVVKEVTVEKKVVDTNSDRTDHKVTTVTETDQINGIKTIVTVIKDDVDNKTDVIAKTDKTDDLSESKTVVKSGGRLNISALGGLSLASLNIPQAPIFGVHVSKDILGPISGGLWGLTDKTLGISLGLTF